jgi:hypothetical protein
VPERLHQVGQRSGGADHLDALVGGVADVVGVGEDGEVAGRQPVAAVQRAGGGVVDRQQAAGGVVLEPLPDIALDGPGAPGQLR